jgi:hypothetical protein
MELTNLCPELSLLAKKVAGIREDRLVLHHAVATQLTLAWLIWTGARQIHEALGPSGARAGHTSCADRPDKGQGPGGSIDVVHKNGIGVMVHPVRELA